MDLMGFEWRRSCAVVKQTGQILLLRLTSDVDTLVASERLRTKEREISVLLKC